MRGFYVHLQIQLVNAKLDRKMVDLWQMSTNPGDDIAGIIYEVGLNVLDLKPGDRVAGLHKAGTPHGSFAEYAVAEANTTFIIPPRTSFEGKLCPFVFSVYLCNRSLNVLCR